MCHVYSAIWFMPFARELPFASAASAALLSVKWIHNPSASSAQVANATGALAASISLMSVVLVLCHEVRQLSGRRTLVACGLHDLSRGRR